MRAILILNEMPTECIECPFCRVYSDSKPTETRCILTAKRNEDGVNTRAEWCPLRPMPSKLVPFGYLDAGNEDGLYEKGYNDCIDDITGETE